MTNSEIRIQEFTHQTPDYKKLLKRFVDFHWKHYKGDKNYVPLLDYEYLGFRLMGITGFFEPKNLFFKHAEMAFFIAYQGDKIVGRCNAFVNQRYIEHWNEKVGFVGQFETINDQNVADQLLKAAGDWLCKQGMERMRGPQNLPVNEATPGIMTDGFDSRPVIYYQYSKPYYQNLISAAGMKPVMKFLSWDTKVGQPEQQRLERLSEKLLKRYPITFETWDERPFKVRREEMYDIYNDAWNDNFNFVPFTREEFYAIVSDMMLIMDKKLFLFVYVDGKPAAFFGGIPNINDVVKPIKGIERWELIRAIKMLLTKNKVKGFRLGYLGVKREFRKMGLDGIMLWKQHKYAKEAGYEYSDLGWILETNVLAIRLVEMIKSEKSKIFTIYEKKL